MAGGEKGGDVRRKITPAMGRCGYVRFRNPTNKRGVWAFNKKLYSVYVKKGTHGTFDVDVGLVLRDGIDSGETHT